MSANVDFLWDLIGRYFVDRPTMKPSEWGPENVYFDEPENRGFFSLDGRRYMEEIVDWWADNTVPDGVLVSGSQIGKTVSIMVGVSWRIVHAGSRFFWVMPTKDKVEDFSQTRWIPCIEASPELAKFVPTGSNRHKFKTLQQVLNGSVVDFVWSNSPSAMSSTPAPSVILDEVDKFKEMIGKEGDPVSLAKARSKSFDWPKRFMTSTPTLTENLIWQELLKSQLRRREIPCPKCSKFVLLIWNRQYTVFKDSGRDAQMKWDAEARREDGSWNYDRVEASARFECPFCGAHLQQAEIIAADPFGRWTSYGDGGEKFAGWHIPSFYSPSLSCSPGALAVKFLKQKRSLLGLQEMINGDFAEPYAAQDTLSERIELVTDTITEKDESVRILTVDCQETSPHFYYIGRTWLQGNSTAFMKGTAETIDEIRAIQEENLIPDPCVAIDSGFGAKSDVEVYAECARFNEFAPRVIEKGSGHFDEIVVGIGWLPTKGFDGDKRWMKKDEILPWNLRRIDPFLGKKLQGKCYLQLLEFATTYFEDILAGLRQGRAAQTWDALREVADEDYLHHLDAHKKDTVFDKRTGKGRLVWMKRTQRWPDHWLDCEILQIVMAARYGLFPIELESKT